MDGSTIALLISLIMCVIGVLTFVSGRMAKAEHNGAMEAKINQALDGIKDIRKKLEENSSTQHTLDIMAHSHEEQIKTLFRMISELRAAISESNRTNEILTEVLQELRVRKPD